MIKKLKKYKLYIPWILCVIAIFLHFSILINTPLFSDDIYNSAIRGNIAEEGMGLLKWCFITHNGWIKQGRFFPFAFLNNICWYLIPDIHLHMMYMVILNVIVILLFGIIIAKIAGSYLLGIVSMIISAFFMPLYTYDHVNAMVNFGGLLQFTTGFIFLSVIFQLKYQDGKKRFLVASAVLGVCAIFTYELGLMVLPINFLVACFFSKNVKQCIKNLFWHVVITGSAACGIIILKIFSPGGYPGAQIGHQNSLILRAMVIQMKGAFHWRLWRTEQLPAYLDLSRSGIIGSIPVTSVVAVILVIIGIVVYIVSGRDVVKDERKSEEVIIHHPTMLLFWLGSFLWIGSSLLIAMSEKYQVEITSTQYPYTPYYLGVFGVIMIFLSLAQGDLKKMLLCGGLIGACVLGMYYASCARQLNQDETVYKTYTRPREVYLEAIDNGILDKVKEGDLVILDNRFSTTISCNVMSMKRNDIKTSYLLYLVNLLQKHDDNGEVFYDYSGVPGQDAYVIRAGMTDEYSAIMIGKIEKAYIDTDDTSTYSNGGYKELYLSEMRLYLKIHPEFDISASNIISQLLPEMTKIKEDIYILDCSPNEIIEYSTDFWRMFE